MKQHHNSASTNPNIMNQRPEVTYDRYGDGKIEAIFTRDGDSVNFNGEPGEMRNLVDPSNDTPVIIKMSSGRVYGFYKGLFTNESGVVQTAHDVTFFDPSGDRPESSNVVTIGDKMRITADEERGSLVPVSNDQIIGVKIGGFTDTRGAAYNQRQGVSSTEQMRLAFEDYIKQNQHSLRTS